MPLPSDIYDRNYFLSDKCEGFDRFEENRGLSSIKSKQLGMLDVRSGHHVLDAGCGRGEVLLACHELSAKVSGIDYAVAAVELTRDTLSHVDDADIRRGDVTDLPFEDSVFDRILFGDVIEHLDPDQALAGLRELRRVLTPGGLLLVHTAPNLLFLKYGWPVARLGMRALGRGEAASQLDDWIAESKRYHVNEQSVFSLRAAMREAGFTDAKAWIDEDVLRSGEHHLTADVASGGVMSIAGKLVGTRPIRTFLGNDLYATGTKS